MRKIIVVFVLSLSFFSLASAQQYRAVYIPSFDTNTQAMCDEAIAEVLSTNLNQVFVQVRWRGDAAYIPNREDDTYPNSEPRGQLYSISPADLDILQYYIDRLHNATPPREVHAWLTTFNSWNRIYPPTSPDHVYLAHPEWITRRVDGSIYTSEDDAPLDPGIPVVQDYVYNIFMDVVRNYDIDGIHFDYIRLIHENSGYNPVAKENFKARTGWDYDTENGGGKLDEVYKAWRRDQISTLVQRVHTQTMLEKPWVNVSGFLVKFKDSVEFLGQGYNWWVAHDAIDILYPGCYSGTVSGPVTFWERFVAKLAQNNDQDKRPLVSALGAYLYLPNNPGRLVDSVIALQNNPDAPDGFNFYAKDAIFDSGPVTPTDLAKSLFSPGGPMDSWVDVPKVAHKDSLGAEFVSPNPPGNAAVVSVGGIPRVTFERPDPASDGDLPVHYRLYRSTTSPVRQYYQDMVMEWWDESSQRTEFSFDDITAPVGTVYYTLIAYDNWNNSAAVSVSGTAQRRVLNKLAAASKEPKPLVSGRKLAGVEVIVDSSPQALDYDDQEGSNLWNTSNYDGYLGGSARYYSGNNTKDSVAVWIVDLPRSGKWAIDGWNRHSTAFNTQVNYRFVDGSGTVVNTTVGQQSDHSSSTEGDWLIDVDGVPDENAYFFEAGHVYITILGAGADSKVTVADGLRFRLVQGVTPTGWVVAQ
jgi:uncharacterized lipoprotein YddW (UPF0748 family)